VVDDSRLNREVVKGYLAKRNYEISEAADGEEALRLISESPPELILLDLLMPGIDGLAVCQRVRENPATLDLPIILLTASDTREARVQGLAAGADDFVSKPFDGAELIARIEAHLRRSDFQNRATRLQGALVAIRGVNHEINNPLMAIVALMDLLEERHSQDPDSLSLIRDVQDACDRVGRVLHRLMNLTEVETRDEGDEAMLDLTTSAG
jgi:DNA-binding response OmpR family regulator